MRELTAIFTGGVAGALARTGLSEALALHGADWPWATFAVNTFGCLVLGAVLVTTASGTASRGLLGPGFCGALTTFSTFQLEVVDLLRAGAPGVAAAFAAASLGMGVAAIGIGRRLAVAIAAGGPRNGER